MSHPVYFGQPGADYGNVERLPQSSFAAFVSELLGHPVILPATRKQFLAATKAVQRDMKRVPYVVPCSFETSPSVRSHDLASWCYLIALDIDNPAHARPFTHHPAALKDALQGLAFAAHTTASHTPANPRLRVYVAAEQISPEDYMVAVRTVAGMLGIPPTRESLVAVQPMYLPTMFRDDDAIADHPLIVSHLDGRPFRPSDIDRGSSTSIDRKSKDPLDLDASDLEFLRPVADDITIADVAEALEYLDPDCDYMEWLGVAAAMRHQFPGEGVAADAYNLFDQWSAKGKKYAGAEDTAAKWNSLRPSPKGRAPVTIRSVLVKAAASGWTSKTVASRCYSSTLAWLSNPNVTTSELMSEGVRRIAAAPLISPLERGTLLARLQDMLKSRKLKVSRADLQKELAHLERAERTGDVSTGNDEKLPKWVRGICYVAGSNEFFFRSADRRMTPEVFDNLYSVELMPKAVADDDSAGKPIMRPRDYALNLAKVPRVDHYRYDPTHFEQVFVTEGKKRFVNTYMPTYPEDDETLAGIAGDILEHHLENLVTEPEYRKVILSFLAYHVQNPGRKIRWAVLLQGVMGSGKTFFAELMRAVLGVGNVKSVEASALMEGSYNDWAMGSQLVAMEEVRVIGHNRHTIMDRLKPLISNDRISINQKYEDLCQVPNITNYMLFTNHLDSLAVAPDERRYFVVHSRIQSRAQILAMGGETYFTGLFSALKNMPGAFRSFLATYPLSTLFSPNGNAPETCYFRDLAHASASPLSAAISEIVSSGDCALVRKDLVSNRFLRNELETLRIQCSDQAVASVLREMGFQNIGRTRLGGERQYLWIPREARGTAEVWAAEAERRFKHLEAKDLDDLSPVE